MTDYWYTRTLHNHPSTTTFCFGFVLLFVPFLGLVLFISLSPLLFFKALLHLIAMLCLLSHYDSPACLQRSAAAAALFCMKLYSCAWFSESFLLMNRRVYNSWYCNVCHSSSCGTIHYLCAAKHTNWLHLFLLSIFYHSFSFELLEEQQFIDRLPEFFYLIIFKRVACILEEQGKVD